MKPSFANLPNSFIASFIMVKTVNAVSSEEELPEAFRTTCELNKRTEHAICSYLYRRLWKDPPFCWSSTWLLLDFLYTAIHNTQRGY